MCERTFFDREYAKQDLTYAQFLHMMDQFPGLHYANATGEGSSFCNPGFPAMLKWLYEHDIYVTAIDSFAVITEAQMRHLIDYVKKVPVSLDGATKEIYESVRVGAHFEEVVGNLQRFAKLRNECGSPTPELTYRMIFFKHNWMDVPKYPALVERLLPKKREGDDGLMEFAALLEFSQTKDWVVELSQEIIEETEANARQRGLRCVWSHASHRPEDKRPNNQCAAPAEPYIDIRGNVLSCCAVLQTLQRPFLEAHAFGNVRTQSFRDIWDSPRYREFRRSVPKATGPVPRICVGCRAFDTTAREQAYGVAE